MGQQPVPSKHSSRTDADDHDGSSLQDRWLDFGHCECFSEPVEGASSLKGSILKNAEYIDNFGTIFLEWRNSTAILEELSERAGHSPWRFYESFMHIEIGCHVIILDDVALD